MKPLFSFLMILSTSSYCQSKISGIGVFKLKEMTVNDINKYSSEIGIPIRNTNELLDVGEDLDEDKQTSRIFYLSPELNKDPLSRNIYYVNHPKVKVYLIDHFRVADMVLHDLKLEFYNDTLYSFYCNGSPKLDSALEIKYGQPQIKKDEKKVICKSIYGNTPLEEITFRLIWNNTPKNYIGESVTSLYYSNKCEKRYLKYFLLQNNKLAVLILNQAQKNDQDYEKQKAKEREKKLSDF